MARQRSSSGRTAGFGKRARHMASAMGLGMAHFGATCTARERDAECGHALHLMYSTRSGHLDDFGRKGGSSGDRLGGHGRYAGLGEDDTEGFGSTESPTWKNRGASALRGGQTGQIDELRLGCQPEPGRGGFIGGLDSTQLRRRAGQAACSFGSTMRPSRGRRVRGPSGRMGPVTSVKGCRARWRRR